MLIRKALEAICVDKEAVGGDLARKLEDVVEKLGLPATFENIARATRLIGNMGAHYGQTPVSNSQVQAVDEFFLGIVEYVYSAPARLERFNDLLMTLPASAGGNAGEP